MAGLSGKGCCVLLSVSSWEAHDVRLSIPGDVNFDHVVKVGSARFLHCKVIVFPSVINKCLVGRYFEAI